MAHQFEFKEYILDKLPAPNRGYDVVQDLIEPRLRLYVTVHGVKSFFVRKRIGGHDRRIILGTYPKLGIEQARDLVQLTLDKKKERSKFNVKSPFKKIVCVYLAEHSGRSALSDKKLHRALDKHLGILMDRPIGNLDYESVKTVIDGISGSAMALRMQSLLNNVFNMAVDTGIISQNPIQNLTPVKHTARIRPLEKFDFNALVREIKKQKSPILRDAFLMLLYGFAPKSKIFAMAWADLDFNHYMWNDMPLSDRAIVLLEQMSQESRWVFPGACRWKHICDPRVAWNRVVANIGNPDLTMDDVHHFLMRKLVWASDSTDLRQNMNNLLDELSRTVEE